MRCVVEVHTGTVGTLTCDLMCLLDKFKLSTTKPHYFPWKQGQQTLSQSPLAVCCSFNLCRYSLYKVRTENKSHFPQEYLCLSPHFLVATPFQLQVRAAPCGLGLWSPLCLVFRVQSAFVPGCLPHCYHVGSACHPVQKTRFLGRPIDFLPFLSHSHNRPLTFILLWLARSLSFTWRALPLRLVNSLLAFKMKARAARFSF